VQSRVASHTEDLKVPILAGIEGEDMSAGSIFSNEESLLTNLCKAHRHVYKHHSSRTPGTDGMTRDEFLDKKDLIIQEATKALLYETYKPTPLRAVRIPKPSGGTRCIAVPTLIDRMIQSTIRDEIQSTFEAIFHDSVHGFRPGRGPHSAIKAFVEILKSGRTYALQMDISRMFDNIDPRRLLNLLYKKGIDPRAINAARKTIKSQMIMDGKIITTGTGIPQGSPLSPLLANVYMHEFDTQITRKGIPYLRYADDCTLLFGSRDAMRKGERGVNELLGNLNLETNPDKTKTVDIRQQPVLLLGFEIYHTGEILMPEHKVKEVMSKIDEVCSAGAGINNALRRGIYNYVKGIISYYKNIDNHEPLERMKSYTFENLKLEGGDLYEYRDLM